MDNDKIENNDLSNIKYKRNSKEDKQYRKSINEPHNEVNQADKEFQSTNQDFLAEKNNLVQLLKKKLQSSTVKIYYCTTKERCSTTYNTDQTL